MAFGTAYQQVENYIFAPRITSRTVSIHPAVAFGSVLVGAALFGPLGALVAVPVTAATQALIESYGPPLRAGRAGGTGGCQTHLGDLANGAA